MSFSFFSVNLKAAIYAVCLFGLVILYQMAIMIDSVDVRNRRKRLLFSQSI